MTDRAEIASGDADRLMLGAISGDRDSTVTPFHFYNGRLRRWANVKPDRLVIVKHPRSLST